MSNVSVSALPRQPAGADPDRRDAGLLGLLALLRDEGYAFTAVTPATHALVLARDPAPARDLRDIFGWSKPFAPADVAPRVLDALIAADALASAPGGLSRSALRAASLAGRLYLHSAFPTTDASSVFFGPDTYRFADAIQRALDRERPIRRAFDVGTGSGAGGLLIADARPDAEVLLGDINDRAIRLSAVNARAAGARNARALRSDLFAGVEGAFDLIVANPPYLVDATRRAYRHGGGPLGGDLSLQILEGALDRLAPGGTLVLYTGSAIVAGRDGLREAAAAIMSRPGFAWSYREADPDVFAEELARAPYDRADRIAAVVLEVLKE